MGNKIPLSERVRPDCEAAPWVIKEIAELEAKLARVTELPDKWRREDVSYYAVGHACAAELEQALLGKESEDA